jgi:glycerol-3-phosphate dehydrogenase
MNQVVSAFAEVRPLLSAGNARHTKKLTRGHEVESDPASGLISIGPRKVTTPCSSSSHASGSTLRLTRWTSSNACYNRSVGVCAPITL